MHKKSRNKAAFFVQWDCRNKLLDFRFFVDHVLTYNGIVFFDFHLAGLVTLVFGRGVKMTGISSGNKFDFIAHLYNSLYILATRADISQNGINAFFVDDSHSFGRNTQAHPAVFTFNPETVSMQIRHESATSFVMGVGNVVARKRAFSGNLTDFRHDENLSINSKNSVIRPTVSAPQKQFRCKKTRIYIKTDAAVQVLKQSLFGK
jgi:hypothetical protein